MTLIQHKINDEFDDVETTLKISFSTSLPNINVETTSCAGGELFDSTGTDYIKSEKDQ